MFCRLDVLQACYLMFLHNFKNLNAVMFPWWLKDSKDSVIDYKTTNVMLFFAWLWGVINEWFSFSGSSMLWQSVFNFPNWLFYECLIKNQANHNLSFVKRKMQGSEWRLQHTQCFAKEILQVSPQYSVFLTSTFPWLLIPYSTYARTYFVSRRQWNTFNERWIVIVGN